MAAGTATSRGALLYVALLAADADRSPPRGGGLRPADHVLLRPPACGRRGSVGWHKAVGGLPAPRDATPEHSGSC